MKNLFSNTVFLAIVACLLWSSAFVGVKIGLQYHTPFQFAGVRFFISGIMLYLFFGSFSKYWKQVFENWKFIALISGLQTVVQYMLFYAGINMLPASVAAMIIGSSPLFISVVSHFSFHNDKMDWLKTLSIILAILGVAVISFGPGKLPIGMQVSLLGVALLLMNNVVSGFSNVIIAKKPANISPVVMSSASLFFGGIGLMIISIPIEGYGLESPTTEYYVALGWLSFLSAAAFSIWFSLLRRPGVKVSILNIWKFLIPVSGAILSWLILPEESPNLTSLIGMALIAAALLIMNYSNRIAQRGLK